MKDYNEMAKRVFERRDEYIHWKSTLRQPVKSIGLFLLCAVAAFVFMYEAVQYIAVSDAVETAAEYYRPIGYLFGGDPKYVRDEEGNAFQAGSAKDVRNELMAIQDSDYVDYVNGSRYTTGFLTDCYNADSGSRMSYSNHAFIIGTVKNVQYSQGGGSISYHESFTDRGQNMLTFHYSVYVRIKLQEELVSEADYFEVDELVMGFYTQSLSQCEALIDALTVGDSYLFRVQVSMPLGKQTDGYIYRLCPLDNNKLLTCPVTAGTEIDWSDPALAQVVEDMAVQEENYRAATVRTVGDMSRMPDIQESYYLADGRLLTHVDDAVQARVCVIRREMASALNLKVGDTLKVNLRDLDSPRVYNRCPYITGEERTPWREAETREVELTIVGIVNELGTDLAYARIGMMQHQYSTIFIPDSLVPSTWSAMYLNTLSSFVLKSPEDMELFRGECEPILEEYKTAVDIPVELRYIDNNWENFDAATTPMTKSALYGAVLFGALSAMILLLAVLLYGFMCRRPIGIQRALGVTRRSVIVQAFLPFSVISALGVALGCAAAYERGVSQAAETLTCVQNGIELTAQIRGQTGACLAGAVWLFALLLLWFDLAMLGRRPVLYLLQGRAAARRRKNANKAAAGSSASPAFRKPETAGAAPGPLSGAPCTGNGMPVGGSLRYLRRHILRSPAKSLLALVIACVFTFSLAYLNQMMGENERRIDELSNTIHIKGQIIAKDWSQLEEDGAILYGSAVEAVWESGYVDDIVCLEGTNKAVSAGMEPETGLYAPLITFVSDFDKYQFSDSDLLNIQYLEGYDRQSVFFAGEVTDSVPVLACTENLAAMGVAVGEEVELLVGEAETPIPCVIAGTYSPMDASGFLMAAEGYFAYCDLWDKAKFSRLEFTLDPAKNLERDAFVDELTAVMRSDWDELPATQIILDDSEIRMAVEPLVSTNRLLRILYPVTVVISVLAAAAMAAMLILQGARETAIMRVLGNTRLRTVLQLVTEQLLLCLLGLFVGLSLIPVLLKDSALLEAGLLCAGLYLAGGLLSAVVCAALTVRRNPLKLLQVKE